MDLPSANLKNHKGVRVDKKSLILESIIQEYLKSLEPISSKQLMDTLEIKISSASIRNYFTKLAHEGALDQIHISSGRIPTNTALKRYWIKRLGGLQNVEFQSIEHIKHNSQNANIFYLVDYAKENHLIQVVNIEESILLLLFEDFHMSIDYNPHYEKFLKEFHNYEFFELIQIAKSLGILQLADELSKYHQYRYIKYGNLRTLLRASKSDKMVDAILSTEALLDIPHGIHFDTIIDEGFMAIKSDTKIGGQDATLFCIGDINSDFSYFLNR